MRQAGHQSLFLGPINRFWVAKVVVGAWTAMHLATALLAIIGGFEMSNAHPRIVAAPVKSAIWDGTLAALGVMVFYLVERRGQRATNRRSSFGWTALTEGSESGTNSRKRNMENHKNWFWLSLIFLCGVLPMSCSDESAEPTGEQETSHLNRLSSLNISYIDIAPGEYQANFGENKLISIARPFQMSLTEITQGQWKYVMKSQPWAGRSEYEFSVEGDNYPVIFVSWHDAVSFCRELSKEGDWNYRLPTDAEWEYSCRAGTTTERFFGDNGERLLNYAWFNLNNKIKHAMPVGMKKPNKLGLFDLYGNLMEWCLDEVDWQLELLYKASVKDPFAKGGKYGICRGGEWGGGAKYCTSAYRAKVEPGVKANNIGFRIVRERK